MTSNDERTDAELLTAASVGEQSAFTVLVRRYVRQATLLAAQFLGNHQAAEDVAQEAFLIVYRRASNFDVERPFAPWFFSIVRRLASNRRTRDVRRARILHLWGWIARREPGTEHSELTLNASLDAASARRALASLSAMQRACFELVEMRELSTAVVAAMHGITESTVRQHVFRARAALREHLSSNEKTKS